MRLVMGSDHAGLDLRRALAEHSRDAGHSVEEVGAMTDEPYDYPDAADSLAPIILSGEADLGVLVCGTGIGVSIRANRYRGIRAALCCAPASAELARLHNHANVLCLGGRTIAIDEAMAILDVFLTTGTDDNVRHVRRREKLDRMANA